MARSHRSKSQQRSRLVAAQTYRADEKSAPSPRIETAAKRRNRWAALLVLASSVLIGSWLFVSAKSGRERAADRATQRSPSRDSLAALTADELETFLKLPDPVSPESKATMDVEAWTNKLDEALQAFDKDLPNDAQAKHLHGLIDSKLKRTQLAEPRLRQAVELAPDNLEMKLDLSDLLTQLGRDNEALTILKSCEQPSLSASYWARLGDCQDRLGQLDDAAASFASAVATDAQNAEAWLKLGKTQIQQQKWAESEQSIRKAIELEAGNVDAWTHLGRVLSLQKRPDEAKTALARARELTTSKPANASESFETAHAQSMTKVIGSAYRSLALLYQAKGNANKAHAMFRQTMEADPSDWVALGKWAALMRGLGEFEQAAQLHKQLVKRDPTEAAHYQNLANISMELNRPRDAEAALRLACLRRPSDGNSHLLLARFLLLTNKPAEAIEPAQAAAKLLDSDEAKRLVELCEPSARSAER